MSCVRFACVTCMNVTETKTKILWERRKCIFTNISVQVFSFETQIIFYEFISLIDLLTDLLVIICSLDGIKAWDAAQQSTASTGHNTLLHSSPGGIQSIGHTVLLLIYLHITCSSDLK